MFTDSIVSLSLCSINNLKTIFVCLDIVIIVIFKLSITHFVTDIKFRFAADVTFCFVKSVNFPSATDVKFGFVMDGIFPFFIDVKFRYMCNSLQIKHDLFRCRRLISM